MGKTIVIEGMDGSGKTTLVQHLIVHLAESIRRRVRHHIFPSTNGDVGLLIREVFSGRRIVDDRAMLPLFIADGLDADARLSKLRDESDYLIVDRHPMISTWAYQASLHSVATLAAMANPYNFEVQPDFLFILDVPTEVAMERRKARGEEPNLLFEKGPEHTEMLRVRYLALASQFDGNRPTMVLDGTLPTTELVEIITEIVESCP